MRRSASTRFLVCVMGIAISACAFTKTNVMGDVLVKTPHGAVFLQHAEDGWFRTAHPFELSPEILTAVFRGVHVQLAPTDALPGSRVFSDEDTAFLSPVISTALSKSTKRQVVGFRVIHDVDGRQETTGGILYIQGRLLHLALTHFRAWSDGTEENGISDRLNPNPTGLNRRQIRFTPEMANRSSRNEQPDVIDSSPLASVVIDYQALIEKAGLPPTVVRSHPIRQNKGSVLYQILEPALPMSEAPISHDGQTFPNDARQTGQVPSLEKEGELEVLKEEVRTLQRRLSELEGNTQRTQQPEPLPKQ